MCVSKQAANVTTRQGLVYGVGNSPPRLSMSSSFGLEKKGIKLRVGKEGKGRKGKERDADQKQTEWDGRWEQGTSGGEGLLLRIYKINSLVRGSPLPLSGFEGSKGEQHTSTRVLLPKCLIYHNYLPLSFQISPLSRKVTT